MKNQAMSSALPLLNILTIWTTAPIWTRAVPRRYEAFNLCSFMIHLKVPHVVCQIQQESYPLRQLQYICPPHTIAYIGLLLTLSWSLFSP